MEKLIDNLKDIITIYRSGFFDKEYYLKEYPDVKNYKFSPLVHYVRSGYKEHKNPNNIFNTKYYLELYPNIKINPLVHYITEGQFKNRNINNKDGKYFDLIYKQNSFQSKNYNSFVNYNAFETKIKLIAYYLPQYHPIEENDKNWGKGFTEWTNVSKAIPQFEEHYQPRLPGELGFYDLRLLENQKRQIELAKNYGIYGFCYHYYWFNGKKVLDLPLRQLLENDDLDFPFCINWANENWTKRWDGQDKDIILEQNYSDENNYKFIDDLKDILLDKRYIRINNKPIVMIYRPLDIPDIKNNVSKWRKYLKEIGIGEVLFIMDNSFLNIDCNEIGFDYSTDFAPNDFLLKTKLNDEKLIYNKNYMGEIYDYSELIEASIQKKKLNNFQSICLQWDNEARKPGKGTSFINFSIDLYKKWLEYILYNTYNFNKDQEKLVFINAWNEWAEGSYLEPDRKYGYSYLKATREILFKFERKKWELIELTKSNKKKSDTAIIIHMYYVDLWDEIKSYLIKVDDFDLFININNNVDVDFINKILVDYPNATIFCEENRGRDILPFIKILEHIMPMKYKYVCKFHTKKSPHRVDGKNWREQLIGSLFESKEKINLIKKDLDADVGILVNKDNIFSYKDYKGKNETYIQEFINYFELNLCDDFYFPAGSMFWFNPLIFSEFIKKVDIYRFEFENNQLDNTYAHAIERVFGLLCILHNKRIKGL